jgi:hypothetical protein
MFTTKVDAMPPDELLEAVRRRPFQPFRMCLTDGQAYEVYHPENCMPGRRVAIVGLTPEPSQVLHERHVLVDLLHVVRLEPIDASKVPGDGQGKGT